MHKRIYRFYKRCFWLYLWILSIICNHWQLTLSTFNSNGWMGGPLWMDGWMRRRAPAGMDLLASPIRWEFIHPSTHLSIHNGPPLSVSSCEPGCCTSPSAPSHPHPHHHPQGGSSDTLLPCLGCSNSAFPGCNIYCAEHPLPLRALPGSSFAFFVECAVGLLHLLLLRSSSHNLCQFIACGLLFCSCTVQMQELLY